MNIFSLNLHKFHLENAIFKGTGLALHKFNWTFCYWCWFLHFFVHQNFKSESAQSFIVFHGIIGAMKCVVGLQYEISSLICYMSFRYSFNVREIILLNNFSGYEWSHEIFCPVCVI